LKGGVALHTGDPLSNFAANPLILKQNYGGASTAENWVPESREPRYSFLMAAFNWQPGHPVIIGMIHLAPLPGTPLHVEGSLGGIVARAVESALALEAGGADGCLIQTVDRLYTVADDADPARTGALTLVTDAVRRAVGSDFAVGVQMMRNAVRASLAVAHLCGGEFVRATALVGATVSAHGIVIADPLAVMEYRRKIGADGVQIVADVDSMHFQWLGGRDTGEVARAAQGVGAAAVAVGHPDTRRSLELIRSVRRTAPGLPVILAGWTNHGNAAEMTAVADGAFVGGCFEDAERRIDQAAVARYVEIARSLPWRAATPAPGR
jgi:uncharacterized protein